MKKLTALVLALSLVLTLAACSNDDETPEDGVGRTEDNTINTTVAVTENITPTVTNKYSIDDIGMTLNEIMAKYPELRYDGMGSRTLSPDGINFYFYFYQEGAGSSDLGELIENGNYGDVLVVAGVIAPVGDVFLQAADTMTLDDFFDVIKATEIEKEFYDDENVSNIRFEYDNMIGFIDFSGHYEDFENIDNIIVHMVNPDLESNNHQNLPWWAGS